MNILSVVGGATHRLNCHSSSGRNVAQRVLLDVCSSVLYSDRVPESRSEGLLTVLKENSRVRELSGIVKDKFTGGDDCFEVEGVENINEASALLGQSLQRVCIIHGGWYCLSSGFKTCPCSKCYLCTLPLRLQKKGRTSRQERSSHTCLSVSMNESPNKGRRVEHTPESTAKLPKGTGHVERILPPGAAMAGLLHIRHREKISYLRSDEGGIGRTRKSHK